MAEKQLTDSEASALSGTTDTASGVKKPSADADPWLAAYYRHLARLLEVALNSNNLRVFEVDSNADAIGVHPGRCVIDGTVYSFANEDPSVDGLTDNDTTYIWAEDTVPATPTGTLQINSAIDGTGWPSTSHIKLAEVTMTSAVITAIVDRRGEYIASNVSALALPVPVAQGGTGSATAAAARTALGLGTIATQAQIAADADDTITEAATITDNSGGVDPGDDIIAAVTNLDTLTDSTGGTADDTVDDVSTAVTGVDGTGNNAASKTDVDTRLGSINNNTKELVDQLITQKATNTALLAAVAQLAAKENTNSTAIAALETELHDLKAKMRTSGVLA